MPASMTGFDGDRELYIEPIRGIRLFRVHHGDIEVRDGAILSTEVVLRALHQDYLWSPGENENFCMTTVQSISTEGLRPATWESVFDSPVDCVTSLPTVVGPIGFRDHDMVRCACGFYAYHSHRYLSPYESPTAMLLTGIIEGYGEVIMGEKGFRAQKARLVAISSSPGQHPVVHLAAIAASERYGVPYFPSVLKMREKFPPTYLDKFPEAEYGRR